MDPHPVTPSDPVRDALARIFGFHAFRPHQEGLVRALRDGRDVFAVMPTGGGKSLCYQLPACLAEGVAVVVSPLIALMKDQVDAARAQGIPAATLNSATPRDEHNDTVRALRENRLRLLYVSPERLHAPGFDAFLRTVDIAFFAVDEAHCISSWGHDFRPDYLGLARLAVDFPGTPLAAFTATATPRVADDIVQRLGLRDPFTVRASFNRPNLSYHIQPKNDVDRQILDFLMERAGESGIVYRGSRKNTESTAAFLRRHGVAAAAYHAGLPDAERARVQDAFQRDETPVVVATIAFGMGIDKSNVRFVVHGDLPKNIEGYYQETGRAGRDGEPAACLLLHARADTAQALRFAAEIPDPDARRVAQTQARHMASFAHGDECRRRAVLAYFGEAWPEENCGGCDICLGGVEREDATVSAQKALSAMARTGGRFGAGHLVRILRGKADARVRALGHDRLPTFGVGADRDARYWRDVIDALTAQGMADVAEGEYPTLSASAEGWRVMRGEIPFQMRRSVGRPARQRGRDRDRDRDRYVFRAPGSDPDRDGARREPSRERLRSVDGDEGEFSTGLFTELKALRARVAARDKVWPYMVFSDRSLREMARDFPTTEAEFLDITGVGAFKRTQYGDDFIATVSAYAEAHPEEAATLRSSRPATAATTTSYVLPDDDRDVDGPTATERETERLIAAGYSVEAAAAERGVKPGTILNHMERLVRCGRRFDAEGLMAAERLADIGRRFRESGMWVLKPVVEGSEGTISYDDAKLARLLLMSAEAEAEAEAESGTTSAP